MTYLGDLLNEIRTKERDLTLREVAAQARVSVSYLSQVETGHQKRPPGAEFLKKLADVYDVPRSRLLEAAGYLEERARTPDRELNRIFDYVQGEAFIRYGNRLWEPAASDSLPDSVKLITIRMFEELTGQKFLTDTFEGFRSSNPEWRRSSPLHAFSEELVRDLAKSKGGLAPETVATRFQDHFDFHPPMKMEELASRICRIAMAALQRVPIHGEDYRILNSADADGAPDCWAHTHIIYEDAPDETKMMSAIMLRIGVLILESVFELDSEREPISDLEREHWSESFSVAVLSEGSTDKGRAKGSDEPTG